MGTKKNNTLHCFYYFFTLLLSFSLAGCDNSQSKFAEGSKLNYRPPLASLKSNRNVSPQVAYAYNLLKKGDLPEATRFINQALQTQPHSVALHLLNALTYEKMSEQGDSSRLDLAGVGYQNALNLDPNNFFALIQLGKLKYRKKQFDQAQELFANALLIKPNDAILLHELAASSYYAYDLKTALSAIDQAYKIKPSDPLIQRSSTMIHAAIGDFTGANQHFNKFKTAVGNDIDVQRVEARLSNWQHLYNSGRIVLAQAGGSQTPESSNSSPTPPEGSSSAGGSSSSTSNSTNTAAEDGYNGEDDSSGEVAPTPSQFSPFAQQQDDNGGTSDEEDSGLRVSSEALQVIGSPPTSGASSGNTSSTISQPQIIVDCYMLRITEEAQTSKGNNILENFSVTLNPGGYYRTQGKASGSFFSSKAAGANGTPSNIGFTTDSGFGNPSKTSGNLNPAPSFSPGGAIVAFNNAGSLSTKLFAGGLTWAGLTYNLNIANAIDRRTEVVARPSLLTFLNKQSVFFSGRELVNGFNGQFGSSLLKYPIGVTLVITPIAINEDKVTLEISIEGSLLTEPNPNLAQTTNVAKARIDTYAKVPLGETLMLGGIYERVEEQVSSGFPGLKEIPLVQYFFSNEQTLSSRRSIVFMLTPRSPDLIKSAINRAMSRDDIQPKLSELINRNPGWFNTNPNLVKIFRYLSMDPVLYYEFRNGDVLPPHWGWDPLFETRLEQLIEFLYY